MQREIAALLIRGRRADEIGLRGLLLILRRQRQQAHRRNGLNEWRYLREAVGVVFGQAFGTLSIAALKRFFRRRDGFDGHRIRA